MTISFERPVGAAADLSELEYVSALHQTQPGKIRTDGSIRDVDIMHFLRSRYGIQVDLDTVRHTILKGLGGDFEGGSGGEEGDEQGKKDGGDDEENEGIDLAEMVAILLIPTLLKSARNEHFSAADSNAVSARSFASLPSQSQSHLAVPTMSKKKRREDFASEREYKDHRNHQRLRKSLQPDRGLLRDVLTMILKDVTGSPTPKRLSVSLVREILVTYGEEELARDDNLLEEMVRAAAGGREGSAFLDASAFARALTSDVVLYDVENETRMSSNYDDVLMAADDEAGSPSKANISAVDEFHDDEKGNKGAEEGASAPDLTAEEKLKLAFGAPALDFVADQFMSKKLVVLLWTGFVLVYFAYRSYIDKLISQQVWAAQMDEFIAVCDSICESYNNTLEYEAAVNCKTCYEDWWTGLTETQGIMKDWDCPHINGRINYGCLILRAIVTWLYILGLLMVLGLAYIGLGSIGNSVRARHKWPIIFGVAAVGAISYVFFFFFFKSEPRKFDISQDLLYIDEGTNRTGNVTMELKYEEEKSSKQEVLVDILALTVSSMAIVVQLYLLIGPLLKRCCLKGSKTASRFLEPGSVKAESQMKQASVRKINSMVRNAREVHGNLDSKGGDASASTTTKGENMSFGRGLINFSLQENKVEEAGGFLWTWRRIFSGEISTVEGVWISARIWAGNLAQVLITSFILFFGIDATQMVVEKWREGKTSNETLFTVLGWFGIRLDSVELAKKATDTIEFYMNRFMSLTQGDLGCDETFDYIIDHYDASLPASLPEVDSSTVCTLLEHAVENDLYDTSAMVQTVASSATSAVNRAVDSLSDSVYPEEEVMVKVPLIVATAVAFLSGITLSLIYIPSVISTTLQLRSGVIPFFHDKRNQNMYRTGMDQVTVLLGSMFWGLLYSAGLLGAVVGGIVFLFLWQATSRQMAVLFTQLVGLVITLVLKFIIVFIFLRATVYVAYYRKRPVQGNLVSLILEVANIGYAIGTVLARAFILVFFSILYVGRLDTPLLANGVGMGPLRDNYPIIFRKDILSHEAHRHPYLEVLGMMYMFKIRYGDKFGNKAGYCFRLVFAVALMPWIRKYRVMARPNLLDNNDHHRRKKIDGKFFAKKVLSPRISTVKTSAATSPMSGRSMTKQLTKNNESENMKLRKENERLSAENERLRAEAERYREALALQQSNNLEVKNGTVEIT